MTEEQEATSPFFFAAEKPPTATAIDDDIYLTVTAVVPDVEGKVEAIDIILSVDYAKTVIAQLSSAVIAARHNQAV